MKPRPLLTKQGLAPFFFNTLHSFATAPLISHRIRALTGYHNPISEAIVLSTSKHTKKPGSELNMHSADYITPGMGVGGNYDLDWEIWLCYCECAAVVYSARSRVSTSGLSAASADGCYCFIVHSVSWRNICSGNNVTL